MDRKMIEDLAFFTICNSAGSLGKFFNEMVSVNSVKTEIVEVDQIKQMGDVFSKVKFNEGKKGEIYIVMKDFDGLEFAKYGVERKLRVQPNTVWDEFNINVIEEMINILAGNMTEVLSVIENEEVEIEAPELEFNLKNLKIENVPYIVNTFVLRLGEKKIFIKEVAAVEFYEELIKKLKVRI